MRLQGQSVDSQPNKKTEKNGGKGSVALWKNSKQFVCVFQNVEPPKRKIYEGTKSLAPKRSVHVTKGTLRHVKIRERKGPSQGVIQNTGKSERAALMLRNLRIDVKKEPRSKHDALAESRGKGQKVFFKVKERTKATFFSPLDVWCLTAPSLNETKWKKKCGRFRSLNAHVEQK